MFNWFKKKENLKDIEFVDKTRMAYQYHPIVRASEVKPHFQKIQTEGGKKFAFSACPGMVDLRNAGYIVPNIVISKRNQYDLFSFENYLCRVLF